MTNATSTVKNNDEGRPPITGTCETDPRNKAESAGAAGMDKAKEMASSMLDRAKDAASSMAHTVGDAGSTVGEKANEATSAVGSGMKSLAGTIRENTPREGVLATASSAVANTLEGGGRYLQEEGLGGMAEDATNLIRRNPIPAVLVGIGIGIGIGFLLAKITTRS
jgi:hypothetical protein